MESSFSDQETRFVLGEMIKASSIDVSVLAGFIRAHNVEQNWLFMQLPVGRNMSQCMGAVEKITLPVSHLQTPLHVANLKRKSFSDLNENPMKKHIIQPADQMMPPRTIQPRPPTNGYMPQPHLLAGKSAAPIATGPNMGTGAGTGTGTGTGAGMGTVSGTGTGTGRKRGRPSRADKEARANSFRVEYPPITPAPPALSHPVGPALVPQLRGDYVVCSPGHEIPVAPTDPRFKRRVKPGVSEHSPTVGNYPLVSPASTVETPRALPEPIEHAVQPSTSPQERIPPSAIDSKSPALPPPSHPPQPQSTPQVQPKTEPQQTPPQTSLPSTDDSASKPQLPQHHRSSEPPRSADPISPDRDRSRSASDQLPRTSTPGPGSTVASRT